MKQETTEGPPVARQEAASRKGPWVGVVAAGGLVLVIAVLALMTRPSGDTISSPSGDTTIVAAATPAAVTASAAGANTAGVHPPGDLQVRVPTIEGAQYDFAAQAGKPMLLFISASWCLPCLGEVPKLAKLHTAYQDQGLEVVALDLDTNEGAEAWRGFKTRAGGADHVWALDPANKVTLALGVTSTDTKIVFNRAGEEIFRTVGPTDYAILDEHVQEALR